MKKVFLLDAFALIFRAHYAFLQRPVTTSKGNDVSAIFGFTKSLQEVLKKEQPSHIAVVFDPPQGSFRSRLFPDYKAHRLQTPEAIIHAVPVIKQIIAAYNIPVIEVPDYEADDVIGTLAQRAAREGFEVYMMTPDKDYGQLIDRNIYIYKPKRSGNEVEIVGTEALCEQYKINNPKQIIDILALWGDAADNIPGAPGIGEVTATKLVSAYGDIDGIYNNIDQLKGKQKESLEQNKEQVMLARQLVTIITDVPCEWNEEAMAVKPPNIERLKQLFAEYEFSSMLRDLSADKPKVGLAQMSLFDSFPAKQESSQQEETKQHKTIDDVEHQYVQVSDDKDIDLLIQRLETSTEFCFDTETTSVNSFDCRLVGMSFAIEPRQAWYVPAFPNSIEKTRNLLNRFKPVFENDAIAKIGQNLKFDIEVLNTFGIRVNGALYDTMLIHYLLNPDSRHNMNYLSETYLNYSPVPIEALIGKKGASQRTMDVVPINKITDYAAEDADVALQLKIKLFDILKKGTMQNLYTNIEAPLVTVLADMEAAGVSIDKNCLHDLNIQYTGELHELEKTIRTMANEPTLNISSPKQLGIVLFEKLNIAGAKVKTTKTKQYATDEETLLSYKDKHPIVEQILEHRSLKKLLSSYIESLPTLLNRHTGKIHTSFNQAVASTGRLSSNNPNLQNIPIREARGREIRKAFIPSNQEYILLSADYSQIELRLMAHLSQDAGMIEAFNNNEDIHAATAAKIYHVDISEISKEQRSRAKTANFGIIYGISVFGLAQRLNIPRSEAKLLIDGYFATYPKVREYMDNIIRSSQTTGYVETVFGRRRLLRDINSGNAVMRGMAERYAINAPIQGTAADIIKIAMININRFLNRSNMKTKMILQVHDELVFDVYLPELDEVKTMVVDYMQNATQLSVPLIVECGTGNNWLQAH
ncbi:MAG: DNA polymerase I [Prevotellaceae bacterium]|jgi:DNA polymerase-1|nr:DNA polymerase I [Prevotellaceae bacterium]